MKLTEAVEDSRTHRRIHVSYHDGGAGFSGVRTSGEPPGHSPFLRNLEGPVGGKPQGDERRIHPDSGYQDVVGGLAWPDGGEGHSIAATDWVAAGAGASAPTPTSARIEGV
jgi:hypothetical protein